MFFSFCVREGGGGCRYSNFAFRHEKFKREVPIVSNRPCEKNPALVRISPFSGIAGVASAGNLKNREE